MKTSFELGDEALEALRASRELVTWDRSSAPGDQGPYTPQYASNRMVERQFEYLGTGRHRAVWRCKDYVVKMPINQGGIDSNLREASLWERRGQDPYIHYARCHLIPHSVILVMEYAQYLGSLSDDTGYIGLTKVPEWAYAVDGWQVGYNKRGQIVAYDYGL